ncbi:glutathione S-transferase family protein [Burkholderia alba]|uniref:glutathione S-transferase family protein n=1 Tax=Burkholderia alba TaxID=2683677 RepID=UPI002B0546A0|nr:glutathione S-transferase [Burkholderia alba]
MLQLCGFPLSNYYNKVKFVLLEYGIPFEELPMTIPLDDPAALADSPFGRVPFLRTESGPLSESQAIVDYLAARYPEKGIYPADPFAAAKARELIACTELYIEWPARDLYPEAYFGGRVSDGTKARVEKRLPRSLEVFKRMTVFGPYVLGDTFCIADAAAFVHLPLIALTTKTIYGRDFVLDAGIDWKAYMKCVGERPAARRVTDERKAYIAATTKPR